MARELTDFKVLVDPPGIFGTVLGARFVDPSKGYKQTEFGMIPKWDKMITMSWPFPDKLEDALLKFGNRVTEVLSE